MEYHAYLLTLYEHEYWWFDSNRHKINQSPFIDQGAIDIFITECYKKKKVPKESFFQNQFSSVNFEKNNTAKYKIHEVFIRNGAGKLCSTNFFCNDFESSK